MATTVRIEEKLAATLRTLASEEHPPIGQVIEDAVTQYQKAKFWKGVHEDFARLRADHVAWADDESEIGLFAGGSTDGVEDEPPYYTPAEEEEIRAEHARTRAG
jgi:predicted transcriptional regulator